MPLPTSGVLSLDAIHVEAGGTSGTTCSLNDSDIRGLNPAAGRSINSALGTNIKFENFRGASRTSSIILQQTVNLNLVKTVVQILTGYDSKGNPVYSTLGNQWHISVNDWNSLTNNSGTNSAAQYLHTGSASATSLGSNSQNFMGALHANAPYDMIQFQYYNNVYTATGYTDNRFSRLRFRKLNSGATNHEPAWDVNAAAPTGWNNFKLEFTYDGTSYTWNYPRSDFATYVEQQAGSFGYYYINTSSSSSADIAFNPNISNNVNTTITGATITIT